MGSFLVAQALQQTQPAATASDSNSLLGWLAGLVLAGMTVAFVARPLVLAEAGGRKRRVVTNNVMKFKLDSLEDKVSAERQSLQDLEFDHELGIIEEQDYNQFKQQSSERLQLLEGEIQQLQVGLQSPAAVTVAKPEISKTVATKPAASKTGNTDKFHFKSAIKEKLKCGECGTPFRPGDRFCSQCSAPLPVICLNCGNEVTEDDRFCAKCGSAVNT